MVLYVLFIGMTRRFFLGCKIEKKILYFIFFNNIWRTFVVEKTMNIRKNTKKKWWKRLFFSTLGIFMFFILLTFLLEDVIGEKVVAEINESITTPLQVADTRLSILRDFPNISLELTNISLLGNDKKPMLNAARLRFKLGFFSLFSKKIDIQSIVFENGTILIKVNKKGKANYDILKPTEKTSTDDKVAFSLAKATLKNMTIGYLNEPDAQDIGFTIKKANFSGDFNNPHFELVSDADIQTHGFILSKNTYLSDNNVRYKTSLQVDSEKGLFNINALELTLDKNIFAAEGTIQRNRKSTNFDLALHSKKCELSAMLRLLPKTSKTAIDNYESQGNIVAKATIKGAMTATQSPAINADFSLSNGRLKQKNNPILLENIAFDGHFSNGKNHTAQQTTLSINNFEAINNNQTIKATLEVENFDFPYIALTCSGKVPLSLLPQQSAEGSLAINDLSIGGFLEDMKNTSKIGNVVINGNINPIAVVVNTSKGKINIPKGNLAFDNNKITVQQLSVQGFDTNMAIDGEVSNYLPVLLQDDEHKAAHLSFNTKIYAQQIDIQSFIKKLQSEKSSSFDKENKNTTTEKHKKTTLYERLEGTATLVADNFTYDRIKGKDFVGNIIFDGNDIKLQGKTQAMNGVFSVNARAFLQQNIDLHAAISCDNIDAKSFFYQTKNFGQTSLTHDNIAGKLRGDMVIDALWDDKGNFLSKKLSAYTYLKIENGTLTNIKMLENFSTFVKIEDLQHIKFTTLENWFEIRDGWTFLPAMNIRSNAMNLTVSGAQSFENDINYNMRINAAQMVVNRFRKFNPTLSPQKDIEDEGLFNLYFNMRGTLDKYDISTAKAYVKGEFDRSQAHKREIQEKLSAALQGKGFKIQEKYLPKTQSIKNLVTAPKKKKPATPEKPFAIPKNYKPKKKSPDEMLQQEYVEGF
jgi:AsmA-like C-terminal region